jgi:hypothetical protein
MTARARHACGVGVWFVHAYFAYFGEIATESTWGNGSPGKESSLVWMTLNPKP